MNEVKEMLSLYKVKVITLNASMPDKKTLKLSMAIRKPNGLGMDKVINIVNSLDDAASLEIE